MEKIHMSSQIKNTALMLVLLASPGMALTDTLRVPVGQQSQSQTEISRPTNGMTQDRVIERFGEPLSVTPAVGEPPISSWEYPKYVVYFEGDTVLHAVLKHRTAPSDQ
jgi:hypothetical protein